MKIRTLISTIFMIVVTILYFFGICQWDIWVYVLSIACALIYMVIFTMQEKKYDRLLERIEENQNKVANKELLAK